eukprot:COSAG03_NODE_5507_length_1232_cov_22.490733_1_plen_36_part_10
MSYGGYGKRKSAWLCGAADESPEHPPSPASPGIVSV